MSAEPGWCGVCGLPVPAGESFCRWPFGGRAGDGQYDDEVVPWASHSLAFMTELVELQHWRCPWCGDYLPDSPRGTAIDHIIPRAYGGPHRRWNLQLLHQECNSAKGKKITAEALELADAHYLGELQTGSVGERGTVSHTVLAAASTWPPGPSSADPAVSLRPARSPGQAITRDCSPAPGSTARLAVIRPSRIAVSRARSAASAAAIPMGQSSAAQTTSG